MLQLIALWRGSVTARSTCWGEDDGCSSATFGLEPSPFHGTSSNGRSMRDDPTLTTPYAAFSPSAPSRSCSRTSRARPAPQAARASATPTSSPSTNASSETPSSSARDARSTTRATPSSSPSRRANSALAAAVIAQRALAEHQWPDGAQVRVRMGLHTGEPAVGEERYVGLGVHRAARIGAVGHGGQVAPLERHARAGRGRGRRASVVRDLGTYRLKDIDRPEPSVSARHRRAGDRVPAARAPRRSSSRARCGAAPCLPACARRRHRRSRRESCSLVAGHGPSTHRCCPTASSGSTRSTLKATQVAPVGDAPDLVIAPAAISGSRTTSCATPSAGGIRNAGDHTLTRVDPSTGEAVVVGGGSHRGSPPFLPATSGSPTATRRAPGTRRHRAGRREDARLQEDAGLSPAAMASSEASPTAAARSGSPRSSAATRKSDTVTQIDPQTGAQRTIHLARDAWGLPGRAGTATSGSTTSTTEASRDCTRQPERPRTVDIAGRDPTRLPWSSTATSSGSADWCVPQVVRLSAVGSPRTSPHLPAHGRPSDWRLDRRGRCRCHLGDDASRPRALAYRSEDEQRDTREPSLPADRRHRDANDVWVTLRRQ